MTAGMIERTRWVPAEPLLAVVRAKGGPRACGVQQHSALERALCRATRDGRLTEPAADQLLVELFGLTMWEVYGDVTEGDAAGWEA